MFFSVFSELRTFISGLPFLVSERAVSVAQLRLEAVIDGLPVHAARTGLGVAEQAAPERRGNLVVAVVRAGDDDPV